MENEIKSLIKVWIIVYASLTFCYFIVTKFPKGKMRLISLFPIITLFALLPLHLSSFHFVSFTAFFITWVANFKLLFFAFNKGPLSDNPSISLLHFIFIACLPIKIKHNPHPQTPQTIQNIENKPSHQTTKNGIKSPFNYAIKVLLLALVMRMYKYKPYVNPNFLSVLNVCNMYLSVEIIFAMTASLARTLLGFDIEPQFDEPYLSTSLQDFWGRRWNLIASSILRPTIYDPIRRISTHTLGIKYASLLAVMTAFLVSGLMHELIFFYLTRVKPTWEVTLFFLLHGVCTALEIATKKALAGRWRLHRAISGPLAIGFVMVTGFWLFFPQMVRNGVDLKTIEEYNLLVEFVKDEILRPLRLGSSSLVSE